MFEDLSYLFFNASPFYLNTSIDDDFVNNSFNDEIFFSSINTHPYSPEVNLVLAVIGTFTSLLTIGGNVLVLLSFYVDRQIRQPTNYFLFSLAISDFLIGCLSMPFLTLAIVKNQWVLGSFLCDIWLSLDYTVCLASIYTVLLITIDRFCSVKMPTKYRNWRTEKRIIYLVLLTWLVPALIFFISTMGYPLYSQKPNLSPTDLQCDVQWNKNAYFNLALTIGYFWVTLLVMFTLYVFIYQVARALEQRSNANKFARPTIDFTRSSAATVTLTGGAEGGGGVGGGPRRMPLPHSSSLSLRIKKKKGRNKRQTSIDDDVGSSFITNHHHHHHHHHQQHRPSNILSNETNRSSSNENSGEHSATNHSPDNFNNLLSITHLRDDSKKLFGEENRSLLPHISEEKNLIHINRKRSLLRPGTSSKARKALRTITLIMGAFVLCWTPWHIHTIIQTFCQTCRESVIFNTYLFHACYFLCYLNSPINPFCYALANRQFKKTYTRLLRLDFRKL